MKTYISNKKQKISAFTIVELLIIIVIIGILAAITIVSYRGITQRSVEASLQADLSNASKKLKISQVDNNAFPATIRCDIPDSNTNLCLKSSSGNTFSNYTYDNTNPQSFNLKASNLGGTISYRITNTTGPIVDNQLDAPSSFASVGGSGQSVLTWVAPSSASSITNYKIYRSTTSGSETLLTTVGNVLTYTDTGLTAGTVYYYKVLAVNADGDGAQSSESSSMPLLSFNNTSTGQTGTIQNWTVPVTGTYTIEANGAQGGTGAYIGGYGARMRGSITLNSGAVLTIVVGQQGVDNGNSGGGGGSSGVKQGSTLLIVAGGGGGRGYNVSRQSWSDGTTGTSGQNSYACGGSVLSGTGGIGGSGAGATTNPCGDWPRGAGGAGVNSDGASGDSNSGIAIGGSSVGSGGGGSNGGSGGYGLTGGGGASYGGGGGGGYSGGAGGVSGSNYWPGGGGGSYNSGTNQSNTAGARSGQGLVTIVK